MFKGKNFKYGTVSVVITVTVILFIVLLNVVLTFLFKRYPLNIDLTENRVFEISEDTKALLSSLESDVVIYVMNSETGFTSSPPQEYFTQANEIIRKYPQYSSRIRLEYIDLIRNPDFASAFSQEIRTNDVIVVSASKYRVIFPSDLFNIFDSDYGSFIASSRAEQAVTSAILNVTGDKELLAAVITGHGEHEIYAFLELLRLNNYSLTPVNLLTGDVPSGASLVILADPLRDLSTEELRKIDAFLEETDKVFFYLASVLQSETPNLNEYLAEWGIAVDSGVVFETNNNLLISPSPYIAIADYAEQSFSANMVQKNLQMVIAQSRPLRAVFDEFRFRHVTPLLRFSPSSGIRPANAPNDWVPGPQYVTGNVPALLLSTQSRHDVERNLEQSHVLVCGSVLALEESTLGNPFVANSEYFLSLLGNLTGREEIIFILDKVIAFTELGANLSQIITMAVVFMALLPLSVLVTGIVVWLRRRHK